MPIDKKPGETKDDFIGRCIGIEINAGKDPSQAAAICYAKWDEMAEVGERGAIKESPKAPKSDTPNKNPKGEGTAKGDASTSRGAEVTERVEDILKKKADEFNDKYKEKLGYGVDVGMLKTVYQRGVGAFNVSHSPRVQSAEQWALARVNAFLYVIKNGRPENPKYVNDNDLLPKKHPKKSDEKKEDMSFGKTASVTDNTWSTEAPININLDSYTDYPEVVVNNAKRALKWVEENGWGDCATPVGKMRANQLANNEPISRDTIARMAAFARHLQYNDRELGEGCAKLSILAWGGKEGIEWAQRKLEQIDRESLSMDFAKISIDYDDTLSTERGKDLAERLIRTGNILYIVSARRDKSSMLSIAEELGIPADRVFATGSNRNKIEKVKELGVEKHYDNNVQVVRNLPGVGMKFKKHKRVIFNEDFDLEVVKKYKDAGYQVHIRSSRKIKRNDNKVWNKLKSVGLTEDAMVFGEVKELNDRYDYDLLMTGQDPILEKLLISGEPADKYRTIRTEVITSFSEAKSKAEELIKSVDLKFVRVLTRYRYTEIPGIPAVKSQSRPFCSKLMASPRLYSIEEILDLPTSHLSDMGLPTDPFQYRGGFYRNPDSQVTTPWCRHQWQVEVVVER